MKQNQLDLGQFICWEHGQNYPFSACMSRLIKCLGGNSDFFSYDFFAGVSGDDFVFAYGNNGRLNDCVSVCEDVNTFIDRVCRRIGLDYTLISSDEDQDHLLPKIHTFIDRGIPVLVKDDAGTYNQSNFDLVCAYNGDTLTKVCGDPKYSYSYKLNEAPASYIFIDSLPRIPDLAKVYRESILQLPTLMAAESRHGILFGAAAYRKWADDIESGRYDHLSSASFDSWRDWCIYVCNIATNARHGWDFIAKAYAHNPDMPNILHLIAILDRNERDCWRPLENMGFGFGIQPEYFADEVKKTKAAQLIRNLANWNDEMMKLF